MFHFVKRLTCPEALEGDVLGQLTVPPQPISQVRRPRLGSGGTWPGTDGAEWKSPVSTGVLAPTQVSPPGCTVRVKPGTESCPELSPSSPCAPRPTSPSSEGSGQDSLAEQAHLGHRLLWRGDGGRGTDVGQLSCGEASSCTATLRRAGQGPRKKHPGAGWLGAGPQRP